ncbi:MAG: ATP-binding protein [Lewinellaceae bacterium]|nr:ATP-binding protein [Lewinellaceae bacterium]
MEVVKSRKSFGERYIVLVHLMVGVAVFYFLVHPLTMVIYWFEMNGMPFTLNQFFAVAPGRILDSFSFQMTGMAVPFIVIGGLVGLGSGLYYRNILQKVKILRRKDAQLKGSVLSIIQEGEGDRVEFKSSLRYDYHRESINKSLEDVIVKTIAGFMNTKGGELLIGVDDKGNILGLKQDYLSLKKKNRDGFELRIYQMITNDIGIEFCSLVQTDFYDLDGKDICVLRIGAAQSPAYVHGNSKTAFYIRAGNSTKPLTIREAVKYINLRQGRS